MNKSNFSLGTFRARLKDWYARNKRAMPWRGTQDSYRVWVSEIMLQQTRVAAALPYYRRFVRRFPTVRALARARSEEVLKLWAGLGYYSRARNLHRAAKEIVARHGGKFPRDHETALTLPGVGRYTAAAVLSIAYGEPCAVVDGNVARVVARLEAVRGDLQGGGRWKRLEKRAQELMGRTKPKFEIRKSKFENQSRSFGTKNGKTADTELSDLHAQKRRQAAALHTEPGEWNQAMMELGATLCTPRAPRCGECPVARWCKARELGMAESIPSARRKRKPERVEIAAAVLLDPRGRTLLVKPELPATKGLFSGMWQFPEVQNQLIPQSGVGTPVESTGLQKPEMNADTRRLGKVNEEKRKRGREEGKGKGVKGKWVELEEVRHSVTFRELRVRPYLVRVRELPAKNGARVVALEKVARMAVSSATKKIARVAETRIRGEG